VRSAAGNERAAELVRVVGVRPLADADPEAIVAAIAPTLQRYPTGALT
jgi:hypothetical protein